MKNETRQLRRIGIAIALALTVAIAYGLGARHREREIGVHKRRVLYYVDPMHPAYKSDGPGIAPDCGMPLQPVYDSSEVAAQVSQLLPPGAVRIDGVSQQVAGISLATVENRISNRAIHTIGRVLAEDTRVYHVNSGVDGFVRETYGDAVGMVVTKGQKLAEYYAPDFLAAASGFLAANQRIPGAVTTEGARSIQNYTDRLRNLGMSDLQIQRITASRQLPESIDVVSPVHGVVLARGISPGQHFSHDMEFYQIADLSRVWVVAELFQEDEPYVRAGSMAAITIRDQGRSLRAKITNSLPESEAGGSTVKFRLELDNPELILRPNMLVEVDLAGSGSHGLTVPIDAVIDSGASSRVYVAHAGGIFVPREVETGWRTEDSVEILKGLTAGERVAVGSTFLVDSESRLRSIAAERGGQLP